LDGRLDLIIVHQNEPVVILRNEAPPQHWVGVELVGKDRRDLVGARVTVDVGDLRMTRFVKGGGSYLSSGDRRLLFGLGKEEKIHRLTVVWPGGKKEQWPGHTLKVDRYWRLTEGADPAEMPRGSGR